MLMTFNIFCRCHSSYIANHLRYKCCNDLNIYEKNELESTFIENANPKKIDYNCGSDVQTSIYGSYRL